MDGVSFADAMSAAKIDVADEVKPEVQIDIVEDAPEQVVNTDAFDSEESLINHFSTEIGYDGSVEGTGVSALLNIAKAKINQYRAVAEDPRVQEYLDHLIEGGSRETFEQMQPTHVYDQVELDEADTDLTRKVVEEVLIVARNYDNEEEVNDFIEDLIDKGKLFEFAEKNLPKLQKIEADKNAEKQIKIKAQIAADKAERDNYYSDIDSAFRGNKLIGIAPNEHWKEVQKLSVPDEKGVVGIEAILDNLNPSEVATMNYAAYCLKNQIPFDFRPKGRISTPAKPIHQIIDKGKQEVPVKQGQGSLGRALSEKIRQN